MRKAIRTLAALGALLSLPATAGAADLMDIYQLALKNDPRIREAEANRLAAQEAKPQAIAQLLPQLNASVEQRSEDTTGRQSFFNSTTGDLVPAPIESSQDTTQWSVELQQSIFDWSRWKQLSQASSQVAQAEAEYQAALDDLVIRVAERYFAVLSARDRLESARANKRAFSRQLDQARRRFEVGLIANTGVQEAQAAYDRAVADEIAAERAVSVARESLREIIGRYPDELARPQDRIPLTDPQPASAEKWVDRAMAQNLAITSARLQAEIAADEVGRRRGGHMPTVDLFARRVDIDQDSETTITFAGAQRQSSPIQDTETDIVGVRLTVPLFSGGAVSSRVEEAVHQETAARERLVRIQRQTAQQARDAYLGVLSEISRVKALRQARQSARSALEAITAGYEVGTRTVVDVLDARRNLSQATTDFAQSRYNYILDTLRLKRAAGTLDKQDLAAANELLESGSSSGEATESGED